MIKPYCVIYDFYYDDELLRSNSYINLLEAPRVEEISGNDFDDLCNFIHEHPTLTPFNIWEFKRTKFIQHYDWFFKRITPENCKPWKLVVTSEETSVSMDRLMNFDTELVIQYLKERGITTCPILK